MRVHDHIYKSAQEHARRTYAQVIIDTKSVDASVWPSVNSSMLNGLQLLLSVINIPAVEILACVRKHDKTATHLSLLPAQTVICLERA